MVGRLLERQLSVGLKVCSGAAASRSRDAPGADRDPTTQRFPLPRTPARALGRGRHAEDRLQRPLPDVLRHRGRRLLARDGAALCARRWRAWTATSTFARRRSNTKASARYDDVARGRHALRAHRPLVAGLRGGGVPRRGSGWCTASWSMSSPTRRRRPAGRCRPRCANCSTATRPGSRCSTSTSATGRGSVRESRAIRDAVFTVEQGIAADLVCDDADLGAVHAVARNRLGAALATGRLLDHARRRRQDRPHGDAGDRARRAVWAVRCSTRWCWSRHATRRSPKWCCMRRPLRPGSTVAPASIRSAMSSSRPACSTSRCGAGCRQFASAGSPLRQRAVGRRRS